MSQALTPLAARDEIRPFARELGSAKSLYELLALGELRAAADQFRPLFDSSEGWHGWVSLEVDPRLAYDARATVSEAVRLWAEFERPNLFVKVPATRESLPAITELTEQGVNVNVTLLFGIPRYIEVANAYMAGLERRAAKGLRLDGVRSVASFFDSTRCSTRSSTTSRGAGAPKRELEGVLKAA